MTEQPRRTHLNTTRTGYLRRSLSLLTATAIAVGLTAALGASTASADITATATLSKYSVAPVNASRLVKIAALSDGQTYSLKVPGVPAGAKVAYLNIATARATDDTSLQFCAGTSVSSACAANNFIAVARGPAKSTMIAAPISGPDKVTFKNLRGTLDLYVDLYGFGFDPGTSGKSTYTAVTAATAMASQPVPARTLYTKTLTNIPAGASAVAVDLSAVSASEATYISACPGDQDRASCIKTSVLNVVPGTTPANSIVIKLGGAKLNEIKFYNNTGTANLKLTVQGYYGSVSAPKPAAPNPPPAAPAPPPASPAPTGKPGAANTGVPAGTTLTRFDGDLTITKPGTIIDAMDIHGFVIVKAPNVTIKRSIIRGAPANYSRALLTSTTVGSSVTIEDSEIFPATASPYLNGLLGWSITAKRVDVHGLIDSVRVAGNNVNIESSWLHDNVHFAKDPLWAGSPSHDDGVQIERGSNIRIVGNTIDGANNAAIMITQNAVLTSNVTIQGNWLNDGGCSLNLHEKGRGPFKGMVVKDNRFGNDQRAYGCAIVSPITTTLSLSNNVWDASGKSVDVKKG